MTTMHARTRAPFPFSDQTMTGGYFRSGRVMRSHALRQARGAEDDDFASRRGRRTRRSGSFVGIWGSEAS